MTPPMTGGCQCGAVRFRVDGPLGRASICHCRMCQKAFGAPFGALVSAPAGGLTWTRGEPARFQSSNKVRRGFCAACGTPLTFEPGGASIELAIAAFDQPEAIVPVVQMETRRSLSWTAAIGTLPHRPAAEVQADIKWQAGIVSYQHPDHDTPER